ncbi:MAG: pilus (MSHA type) biogenesis protein MshL [Methylotenera sp.]|nr:pilus (MSHA type) biogenesis protein MshL [Methylotenera sp.]
MLVLAMSACAHESTVLPSKGHIDGQVTAQSGTNDSGKASTANIPKPVVNNAYLPPPKPATKEQTYSIVVYDTPVKEVLFAIARDSKLNVDIHPSIRGNVTLNAVDQTLPAILERLSKQVDLTYKIQGNVLSITPDQPELRTYGIDYVNMSRDTLGFIGAAAEISGTGQGALDGTGGSAGGSNISRTSISSESKSHFWETLEKNIKDILAETDKEVIVARTNSLSATNQKSANNTQSAKKNDADVTNATTLEKEKEDAKNEYKTLFAGTVIVNREAGVINVRATNKQHEKVQEFLDKVMGSVKRQVLIEATIVEVRLNDSYQAGIDWAKLAGSSGNLYSNLTFGQQLGSRVSVVDPITGLRSTSANAFGVVPVAGFVAAYTNPSSKFGNIAASINLLEQFGKTAVLSSPKLMVLNNQTAVLKVVDNLVYFTVKTDTVPGTGGSPAVVNSTSTAHTVPVGVVMTVTPQINNVGNVNINVRPTVSRKVGDAQDPVNDKNQIPVIQVREMESMLQIASGNTAILGGLMQDEAIKNTDQVPGVSKIPMVGKAFTGKNDANRKTELVIFLRPTVISNASLESDELSTYKQYLPTQALERALPKDATSER